MILNRRLAVTTYALHGTADVHITKGGFPHLHFASKPCGIPLQARRLPKQVLTAVVRSNFEVSFVPS